LWVAFPPGAPLPPPPPGHPDNLPDNVRRLGTFTADLEALAEALRQAGVTTVAMGATGVYWVPLYDVLEGKGLRPLLADPRQTHDTPGRPKTDVKDCMWIQRLHSLGLLRAAFRPDDAVRAWRGYQRHRKSLVEDQSRQVLRMQKALEQMNVKRTEVVSDVTGVTGLAIIRALVAGERDPVKLARLRQRGCRNDEETIARALQGNWRAEHLFELGQCLRSYEHYQRQVAECDGAIEGQLKAMALPEKPEPLPPGKQAGRRGVPKAITATAYKLARVMYGMLRHGSAYAAKGMEEYEKAYRERAVRGLRRKAAELGLEVLDKQGGPPA